MTISQAHRPDAAAPRIGAPIRRIEDPRLITGRGQYVGDLALPGMVFVRFVRSPYAHAQIVALDLEAARAQPGVVGVYAAADLPPGGDLRAYPLIPGAAATPHPVLAREVVRFVGEPIVAVLAVDPYRAADAAERVRIDYAPLAAVVSIDDALAPDAPTLHEAAPGNLVATRRWEDGDVAGAFASADHVVDLTIRNSRIAPLPLEARCGIARHDPATDDYTLWSSTQVPHRARTELCGALGLDEGRLRVIVPDVGGGFGAKVCAYREDVALLMLARLTGRPIKWLATRGEDFATSMHARESVVGASGAFSHDGRLLGMRVTQTLNAGAYLQPAALFPAMRAGTLVPGAYAVAAVASEVRLVYSNTTPTGPYRGAGRPEASLVVERLIDLAARDLELDPIAIRRRNFLAPGDFPHTTPTGLVYDSGDYTLALDRMLELADYDGLRAEQARARAGGELFGIGVTTFVEPSGGAAWEGGQVRVERSGDITVATGAGPHGQGTATTLAQIVADRLGVPLAAIRIRSGDTAVTPPGVGSFGSRSAALAGSALVGAAEAVAVKARRIAAHLLECATADLEPQHGGYTVRGTGGHGVTLAQIAATAYAGVNLPPGDAPGLEATELFRQEREMFSFGAYLAVVRLLPETGAVQIDRLIGVGDSGTIINPLLAEGQIIGGVAQGIGQALFEQIVYDDDGQLITGSFLDYAMPRAEMIPPLVMEKVETPSPLNPLGAKGLGEAGTVGAPTAIVNAVVDALAPLGVRHVDMPITDERIWHLLREFGQHAGA